MLLVAGCLLPGAAAATVAGWLLGAAAAVDQTRFFVTTPLLQLDFGWLLLPNHFS
jgi:hypothetical protein